MGSGDLCSAVIECNKLDNVGTILVFGIDIPESLP